ncbi:MAG: metallophosphoesterase [Clostridia bacterium]|nr:metallophosphoesterase [Clostridia bacterium]
MKKLLSVLLAVIMLVSAVSVASAGYKEDAQLKFDENGNFKIMVLADIQTGYPVPDDMISFIFESVDFAKPDVIVLCGDNINTEEKEAYDDVFNALDRTGVPYTAVLGNHDEESSGGLTRDEIIERYMSYDNYIGYDADPSLHGAGTHNLPVLSSDGSKLAFNLWMFDCGDYVYNSAGEWLGYDWVRKNQIEWYNSVRDEMTAENGGELVPSIAFQHIIPQEPCEKIFVPSEVNMGDLTINFQDGTSHTFIPDINKYEGYLFEKSCPSYGNDGQWDAMLEGGDVLGVVVGHDHVNNFVADVDGIDLIQTPGCTFTSYYNDMIQGARVIEINEENPWEYSTYNLTANELAQDDGSALGNDRSEFDYTFSYYLEKFFAIFMNILRNLFSGSAI